jgi:hypothetical protein
MRNIFLREEPLVILFLIESYDSLDIKLLEYLNILAWMMTISLVIVSLLDGAHKSHELAWDNPVKVSIFNPFVLLIFFNVEGLEVVPFEFDGILETLQAL